MHASWILALPLVAVLFPLPSTTNPPGRAEVARIRAHLARAQEFAAERDLAGLSAAQKEARSRQLQVLAAYRERGLFPRNRVSVARTPVFVDDRGVHCAVGHLLAVDGETWLVAKIAATRNCARVAELADEPELVAWLDRNGLTLEEAARIQPTYDGGGGNFREGDPDQSHNRGYEAAVVASTGLSLLGVGLNLERGRTPADRSSRVLFATVVGGLGIGLGAVGFSMQDENGFATVSTLAGLGALVSTTRNRREAKHGGPVVAWLPMPRGLSRVALIHASF